MNRIKQFRLARGYSLDELAVAMGGIVTKQSLSKYERDLSVPSAPVLNQLAAALRVKAIQLRSEPSVRVRFLAYRKRSTLPRKAQALVQALVAERLEERVRLQDCCSTFVPVDLPIEQYEIRSEAEAENAAAKVRDRWKLGVGPIANLTAILEDHLVHVIEVEAPEKFDGISAVADDEKGRPKAAAVVSRVGCPGDRQRLNLAHELGHLFMKPKSGVDPEKAAFRFAGAFLAPRASLEREIGPHRTSICMQELLILKRRFGMSMQALARRMLDLEIISQATYKWACIHFSKLGFRKEEPEPVERETSEWLRQAALRCWAEGFVSKQEAERLIGEKLDDRESTTSLRRRAFLRLPMEERRRVLQEQSAQLQKHYETDESWRLIQDGDVIESR
ncbi:MAG TPA: XRE family transcriptional regulator [Bryobacteraceae bacterium]|nr:XRE family transcriptional regulator [Bryobacteraceae bacterium]